MWAGSGPASSSVPVPSPSPVPVPVPVPVHPVPDDLVPVPVTGSEDVGDLSSVSSDPVTGSKDDGDLSSVSSDHPDPPNPDPVPAPSYPSLTVDDIPRTKHPKLLSSQPTAFPFSSPRVPVIPKSKSVSFRK